MKSEKMYYLKQKFAGLLMTVIGILIPFIDDGDATITVFALPLGIYTMFTKEKVICSKELFEKDEDND